MQKRLETAKKMRLTQKQSSKQVGCRSLGRDDVNCNTGTVMVVLFQRIALEIKPMIFWFSMVKMCFNDLKIDIIRMENTDCCFVHVLKAYPLTLLSISLSN